jgi:aspartyl/asparaginyl beta-hydroxylase (cupin superfamily)
LGNHRDGAGQHDGSVVDGGDWREVVLFARSGGHPELAPRTAKLIREYCSDEVISLAESGAGEVIFSVLRPGTRLQPHTASHNLRLTAHLGLKVPTRAKSCFLNVAGEDHIWEKGKMIVFDDSFEHYVVNDSDEYRAVLLIRFWHPSLAVNLRMKCLDEVLRLREEDAFRRYNPPIPPEGLELPRGMKRSRCTRCSMSGFDSVRVIMQSRSFYCTCLHSIDEGVARW